MQLPLCIGIQERKNGCYFAMKLASNFLEMFGVNLAPTKIHGVMTEEMFIIKESLGVGIRLEIQCIPIALCVFLCGTFCNYSFFLL